MRKRLLSILLCGVMLVGLLPTAAFAEDSAEELPVCSCETACTSDNMNKECPVCGAESAAPQSCGQYVSVEDGTGENSSTEEADDPDGATALSAADQVQAMINALPSAAEIAEENAEEVEAQLDAIDKAKENLTAEEIDKLDLSRYNEVATVLADMAGLMSVSAFAAGSHTHCFCGGNVTAGDHTSHTNVTYQAWNGTDSITYTNGVAYVYLTGNATINKNLEVIGGNCLYLCLNGKTLASNGTNKITVKENSHLTISDCAGGGTIKGATSGWGGMCIYIYHSTVDLFGGKLTGGKVTGKGGGGAIALDDADCVLNLYGGEITGNDGNQRGGGIYMLNGTLNIYGGTISGNKSSSNGGAVYVTKGTVNMSGGTISGNTAGKDIYTGYGGAVCIGSGTMNMSGGKIVDNHAYRAGGIYGGPNGGVTITISGGRITENTASEIVKNYGAGVMNNRGTTTLRGNPYIRGNYAVLNGTVNNGYANLYYENGKNRLRVENLTEGADIGITIGRSLAPTEGTPLVFSEACDKNYSGYFTSDEGYDVGYNTKTKQLELRVPCKHSNGTLQWTTTPTTHEQAWSCCGLVTIPETAHTWENGKCTVCEYVCLHDGGTATCTQKAVCRICGSEYGDFASHSFTAETVDAKYLKSAATCTDKAVYYKSCSVCGLTSKEETGEATFESGELDASNHTGKPWWGGDGMQHWWFYPCCHAETGKQDHVYDNPTDTMCNVCRYIRTIRYTVTLNTNGGTIADGRNVTEYIYGKSATLPIANDMTYTGHTFKGWYDNEGLTGSPVTAISSTETGDKAYWAKWEVNQYTVTVKPENGEADIVITQDYDTTITAPVLTRDGYRFKGWDKAFPATMPAENMTITAQWLDVTVPTGEIKIAENGWKSFFNNITFGLFFKDTQAVTVTATDNSGETVTIEYLLSDKELTETELAGMTFTAYSAPFAINPDNEYVIYAKLTDTAGNTAYISSQGIVLDATVPAISGIEAGKTYCAAQTVTVTEKYIDTVTVNGKTVTLDSDHRFTLDPAEGVQTVVVTDKAGNKTTVSVTVNGGHTYEWQSENGQYWQKCKLCGFETDKKDIPTITVTGSDRVCRTQDYTFRFTLPEGATDATYGCEFIGIGWGSFTPTVENDVYSGILETTLYLEDNSFKLIVRAKTADGFEFSTEKIVTILDAHTGGTATCKDKAKCEICGENYGERNAKNHSDLKHFPAVAATRTAEGNIEYWYCSGCGKYYKDAKATQKITKADTVTAKLPSHTGGGTGAGTGNKPGNDAVASPNTGDSSTIGLWSVTLCGSLAACLALAAAQRRRKREQ